MNRSIAGMLARAREDQAMTQELLAAQAGVSVQTVQRAEQTGRVGAESLRALCAGLGLDASVLGKQAQARDCVDMTDLMRIPTQVEGLDACRTGRWERAIPWLRASIMAMILLGNWSRMMMPGPRESIDEALTLAVAPMVLVWWRVLDAVWAEPPMSRPDNAIQGYRRASPFVMMSALAGGWTAYAMLGRNTDFLFALFMVGAADTMMWKVAETLANRQMHRQVMAARTECDERTEGMLAMITDRISRIQEDGEIGEIKTITGEMVRIAAAAGKGNAVRPLTYLVDDIGRGISPRRDLERYVTVCRTLLDKDAAPRLREDAERETTLMRDRINAFA